MEFHVELKNPDIFNIALHLYYKLANYAELQTIIAIAINVDSIITGGRAMFGACIFGTLDL